MKDTRLLQVRPDLNFNFWFYVSAVPSNKSFDTSHMRLCEGRVSEPECDQRRPRPLFYVASTSQTLPLVPAAWCHSYSAFNTFSIITSTGYLVNIWIGVSIILSANDNTPNCVTCIISILLFYSILFYHTHEQHPIHHYYLFDYYGTITSRLFFTVHTMHTGQS